MGVRQASLHSLAAYISSVVQFRQLLAEILSRTPSPLPTPLKRLLSALQELPKATRRHEWATIEEIDVPLCQHYLSREIDFS